MKRGLKVRVGQAGGCRHEGYNRYPGEKGPESPQPLHPMNPFVGLLQPLPR